ncbi:MAG: hypothetical protein QW324_04915 [Thermofilaceae archaeon]
MDGLAGEILAWALSRSERNVVSLTPRRVRKIARQRGERVDHLRVRRIIDQVIEGLKKERRVLVRRRGRGTRVVYVLPPGAESPYLEW